MYDDYTKEMSVPMRIMKEMSIKEWSLSVLLFGYIGGFAYFWGANANDLYLIVVVGFLTSHFIGSKIWMNAILQTDSDFKIAKRLPRVVLNFAVNMLIGNIIMFAINLVHPGRIDEFLAGPVVYGLGYGLLYTGYMLLSINTQKVEA